MQTFVEKGVHPDLDRILTASSVLLPLPEKVTSRPHVYFDFAVAKQPAGACITHPSSLLHAMHCSSPRPSCAEEGKQKGRRSNSHRCVVWLSC